jgi:hypothetical protein
MKKMELFAYEMHDDYKDLRGKNIIEQLHLAGLAAVSSNPQLMMTNI